LLIPIGTASGATRFRPTAGEWIARFVIHNRRLAAALLVAALTAACGRQPDAATQLGELEQAFDVGTPTPSEAVDAVYQAPDEPAMSQPEPQIYVNRAVAAVRAGEPAEGVMLLQSLQQMTGMNAQERMAVQKTIRAVTADLVRRAADGDPHAQAELKRIERFLSVR
jgi:hypothetical protein